MSLSKSKGHMYDWCSHMHTHIGGLCPHQCIYCSTAAIGRRFKIKKYTGKLRLIEKELTVNYRTPGILSYAKEMGLEEPTIFIEHCTDLFAEKIPFDWITSVLLHCNQYPENLYVFQTKNPARMVDFVSLMPPKRILGCTIETTSEHTVSSISKAPSPLSRRDAMMELRQKGERMFITIEPILDGSMRTLARWCHMVSPEFVNIGADSKGGGLKEPSASQVRLLISSLQHFGVEIRAKNNLDRILNK